MNHKRKRLGLVAASALVGGLLSIGALSGTASAAPRLQTSIESTTTEGSSGDSTTTAKWGGGTESAAMSGIRW